MKADKIKTAQHSRGCYVPGITGIEGGIRICTVASGKSCSLLVYEKGGKKGREIPFPPEQRIGNVWSMEGRRRIRMAGLTRAGSGGEPERRQDSRSDACSSLSPMTGKAISL